MSKKKTAKKAVKKPTPQFQDWWGKVGSKMVEKMESADDVINCAYEAGKKSRG